MNVSKFNTLVIATLLATAFYAKAEALSSSDVQSVRAVLRALNIDESQLSNEDLEVLRNEGRAIQSYEKSKSQYLEKAQEGEIYRTCGAGSHGGDKDPV